MKAGGGGIGAGDRDRPGDRAPGAVTDASGPEAGTPVLAARHVEAIMAAAEEAHSPATRRAYKASWRVFRVWVRGQGLDALPAAPETVAAYLAERAGAGVSRSTLAMARAAIRYHHETSGLANPCDSPGVRRVLRGLNRRAAAEGPRARQAAGLTAVGFAAIRATARLPRIGRGGHRESEEEAAKRGAVDIALAAVMRDALLRRAEAAALRWGDVEFRSDGSARITIRRSKNDQDGRGIIQFAGPPAAEALGAIRPGEVSAEARVFGLRTGRSISNRLSAMAKAAGLGDGFSGHSPRVGMAQDLAAACTELPALMVAGRWKSARMPAHYASAEFAGRGAVARYYGMAAKEAGHGQPGKTGTSEGT